MFCDFVPVQEIRIRKAKDIGLPTLGGVYKWWCYIDTLKEFLEQLNLKIDNVIDYIEFNAEKQIYCFYVGQTKARRGLARRIKTQHVGKFDKKNPNAGRAIQGSTLRLSINSLKNGRGYFDEKYVDEVLDKCFVQWVGVEDVLAIDKIEKYEINAYLRILNLDDFEDKGQEFVELRNEVAGRLSNARRGARR